MRTSEEVAAMACPVCNTGLSMSDRQGVEIDYCPRCRGVWLDRGELDKIIERSDQMGSGTPPSGTSGGLAGIAERVLQQRGDDRHYYGKKRKKSLLHELFD